MEETMLARVKRVGVLTVLDLTLGCPYQAAIELIEQMIADEKLTKITVHVGGSIIDLVAPPGAWWESNDALRKAARELLEFDYDSSSRNPNHHEAHRRLRDALRREVK